MFGLIYDVPIFHHYRVCTFFQPFIPNVLLHDQKEDQPATNGGGQVNSIGQNYGSTDSPENVATPEQVQVHPAATDSFTPWLEVIA